LGDSSAEDLGVPELFRSISLIGAEICSVVACAFNNFAPLGIGSGITPLDDLLAECLIPVTLTSEDGVLRSLSDMAINRFLPDPSLDDLRCFKSCIIFFPVEPPSICGLGNLTTNEDSIAGDDFDPTGEPIDDKLFTFGNFFNPDFLTGERPCREVLAQLSSAILTTVLVSLFFSSDFVVIGLLISPADWRLGVAPPPRFSGVHGGSIWSKSSGLISGPKETFLFWRGGPVLSGVPGRLVPRGEADD